MHRAAAALLLLLMSISLPAHAKPPAKLAARIDAVMAPWAKKDGPGCSVAVVQNGKVIHKKGYGMADLEHGVPNGPDTIFDIGSTSKQFTASSLFLLAADGKLGVDDDVRKHVPELPSYGKDRTITLRHLLNHTSGLRDYTGLMLLAGWGFHDVVTPAQTLEVVSRQKAIEFSPGTQFAYSNTGYFLLSLVIERAAGMPYPKFANDRIFAPMGMTRTHVHADHNLIVPGRAIGYNPRLGGGWQIEMSPWEQLGDGAVFTTVLDLARWDANFYDPRVGGQALLDALHTRGKLADGKENHYAAGLRHDVFRGLPTVSHGGAWAGYRAEMMRFPTKRTTVIVLCNSGSANPTGLALEIAAVVLEKDLAPEPAKAADAAPGAKVTLSEAELDAWTGTYKETTTGEFVTIRRDGDKLVAEAGGETFPLAATGKQDFVLEGLPVLITIHFEGIAPARKLTVGGDGPKEAYEEAKTFTVATADLAAYAGRYRSAELGVDWMLTVEHGALVVRVHNLEGALAPTARDGFSFAAAGARLEFTRNKKGVTGFALHAGRLVGLRFERLGKD